MPERTIEAGKFANGKLLPSTASEITFTNFKYSARKLWVMEPWLISTPPTTVFVRSLLS